MIGLDFTTMDEVLIEYTAFLVYYVKPEVIYFVNVQEELEFPEELQGQFPELDSPVDEQLEQEMKEKVAKFFPEYRSYEVHFEVVEGLPKKEILKRTHIKNVDLLIVGRKQQPHGSGMIPRQLARKVSCSVLFVPEKVKFSLRKILVPVDFSKYSTMAAEEAIDLVNIDEDSELIVQHVYKVPYGYYKTGKTEAEFAGIMKKHAAEKCDAFVDKIAKDGVKITQEYSYDHERKSPARLIHQFADEHEVDLIMVGARGRNVTTAILLGSVAEKLLNYLDDKPVWIVKRKDQSFSFLDVIDAL